MKQLRAQLKQLRTEGIVTQPDQAWVLRTRERLVQQIKNTTSSDTPKLNIQERIEGWLYRWNISRVTSSVRPVFTALAVAIAATGGWIASVSASSSSLPGDRLWSIKRAAQKTELVLKSFGADEHEKIQLQLALAKSRTADIKQAVAEKVIAAISADDRASTVKDLQVAVKDVEDAVKSASASASVQIKNEVQKNPESALGLVKDVTKDTTEIAKSLNSTATDHAAAGIEVVKNVIETAKVVNAAALNTVETVVNAGVASGTPATNLAVKTLVNEKLTEITQTTADIKQVVANVKDAVIDAATTSTARSSTSTTSSTKINLNATSTLISPLVGVGTNALSAATVSSTATALKEVEQKTAGLESAVPDIKKSLDAGDLRTAVDKLKDLTNNTGSVQQMVVETKNKVNLEINTPTRSN